MQAPMTIKQYVSQMRKIPGGRFTMGRTYDIDDPTGFFKDEVPAKLVDMSPLRMGATPVTVGMWREYVRSNSQISMPKAPPWDWIDDHPMVNISWNDIVGRDGTGGYCRWATKSTGVKLSLPTEAQWEYAAKLGSSNLRYPWGRNFVRTWPWWGQVIIGIKKTAPVIRGNNIYINPYGVSDLSGNVCQWCFDVLDKYSPQRRDRLGYSVVPVNPKAYGVGPMASRVRVHKGGSWKTNDPEYLRCNVRYGGAPDYVSLDTGFRLVAGSK